MPHRKDKQHVPPPSDEIRPARAREKQPPDVKMQKERMESEGGGSAPRRDSPADGDLRRDSHEGD